MKQRRIIAIVTGTRAEFGLLKPVMRAVGDHRHLVLQTWVTGTHLTTDSLADIRAAGFAVDAKVLMQRRGETGREADIAALGRGVTGFGKLIAKTKPTVVVVLGDRIEAFAAATAGHLANVHVAHLHGGDRAQGVADESLRHAISKLSHLHFPATGASRRRLLRMGERPEVVFNVGSPAIDGLRQVKAAVDGPQVIVMQHPVGGGDDDERQWMAGTLAATAGGKRLVMMPNHDPGRQGICQAIKQAGVQAIDHLPRERFLSLLKGAQMMVGNSSAGLIEAAALKTPAVNVGPRQAGRERPKSVVDCDYGQRAVAEAMQRVKALDLKGMQHPYGHGRAGERVAERLAAVDLRQISLHKQNRY